MGRGLYIILEGFEGGGKTTHSRLLKGYFNQKGLPCVSVREPGGTRVGEQIRRILLDRDTEINPRTELYLFGAARAQIFSEIVIPSLEEGIHVISDRGYISTEAYQHYGRGVAMGVVKGMNQAATFGTKPDLVFMLGVSAEKGVQMATVKNRFEGESSEFHQKVVEGYTKIAKRDRNIITTINYREGDIEGMQQEIRGHVDQKLAA